MKTSFCCDASRSMYEDYYMTQCGNGIPGVFAGARNQRGHGLGSMLSGLFRRAMPIIKRGLKVFGKQALRTGANIANDVASGHEFSTSAKTRMKEGIKQIDPSEFFISQRGSGKRKIKRRATKKARKRRHKDIFD